MTTEAKLQEDLNLKYLVKPAITTEGKKKALILLHGVGSNEQDLFSLAPLLPDNFLVISPRGPVTLGPGRYAWYQVDFSSGAPVINAQQEEQSRALILDFVRQVKQQYAVEEVYLGGFSQGAIMSYSIGLTNPTEVNGVVSFSGRILMEIRSHVEQGDDLKQLAVFLAHGTQDNTLPVHYAREAKAYLEQLGVKLSYHELEMGHQINNQVLEEVITWLNSR